MIKINNISNLVLTKLNVLYFLKYLKVLIYYKINNKYFNYKKKFVKFNYWKKNNKKYFLNELNFYLHIFFYEKKINISILVISIGNINLI
ncbi:MAG: hypothetical protein ACSLEG_00155 [Candidatus Carsonella ruddii]